MRTPCLYEGRVRTSLVSRPRALTARVIVPTVLISLSRHDYESLLDEHTWGTLELKQSMLVTALTKVPPARMRKVRAGP